MCGVMCNEWYVIFQDFFVWSWPYESTGDQISRIRETKHLSTDADSITDAIGGWTKNTAKPDIFENQKKSSKLQKLKKHLEICQN